MALLPLVHRALPPRAPSDRPPLVVLLHGLGTDEDDLLPLAPHLDPRLAVVSVRAPHENEPMGYRWYALDWRTSPPRSDVAELAASRDLLASFLERVVPAVGADPARVFLLGFSQGAVVALALLLARPDLVRGVIAHSGRLVSAAGAPPDPAALAHAEVLVLHGEEDDVIPAANARGVHEALTPLLGDRVTARVHPGLGHGVSEESLRDVAAWLGERVEASRATGGLPLTPPSPRGAGRG